MAARARDEERRPWHGELAAAWDRARSGIAPHERRANERTPNERKANERNPNIGRAGRTSAARGRAIGPPPVPPAGTFSVLGTRRKKATRGLHPPLRSLLFGARSR